MSLDCPIDVTALFVCSCWQTPVSADVGMTIESQRSQWLELWPSVCATLKTTYGHLASTYLICAVCVMASTYSINPRTMGHVYYVCRNIRYYPSPWWGGGYWDPSPYMCVYYTGISVGRPPADTAFFPDCQRMVAFFGKPIHTSNLHVLWKCRPRSLKVTSPGHVKWSHLITSLNARHSYIPAKRLPWNFQRLIRIAVCSKCIYQKFYIGDLRSGQFCDLFIISQWGDIEWRIFGRKPF